jgi:integrase/recombinase XerD
LGDYDPSTGRVVVRHGKGDKDRTVYAGHAARRALWRYLADRATPRQRDWLFPARNGRAMSRYTLRNIVRHAARRAGMVNANVHRFRHTFAINFLRNGGNVLELQQLLGHENLETVRVYVKLAQTDLVSAQRIASPADRWGL